MYKKVLPVQYWYGLKERCRFQIWVSWFSLPALWCQVLSFARSSSCENLSWLGFAGSQQSEEAPGYWRHGTEMRLVLHHFLIASLLMRKKNHRVATTNWLHIVLRRRALPQPILYLHENSWPDPSAGLMNLQDCEEEQEQVHRQHGG